MSSAKIAVVARFAKICDRSFAPSIKDKGLGSRGTITVDPGGIKVAE